MKETEEFIEKHFKTIYEISKRDFSYNGTYEQFLKETEKEREIVRKNIEKMRENK